jgi:hypothetical protein
MPRIRRQGRISIISIDVPTVLNRLRTRVKAPGTIVGQPAPEGPSIPATLARRRPRHATTQRS